MTRLKLGPIPDDTPVRRTIVLSAAQDALLRDYVQALAAQEGMTALPTIERLIPVIVERFIATDRAFRRPRAAATSGREGASALRDDPGRAS